ncbi:hypothetical protein [Mesotoga prima]|uniref:hypothetical protein n=1 Tax=Mesotoga prima TaxID=1184387 RepID=UPI00259A64C1|nr:hypothetical protein [Mesotoga prima]HQC15141.1 hypothetical protein [Mesotoga prima]
MFPRGGEKALDKTRFERFKKWFPEQREYLSIVRDPDYQGSPDSILLTILGISRKNLKPYTEDLFSLFRENQEFSELVSGIQGYIEFQDILDISINAELDFKPRTAAEILRMHVWNRHYCFYESLFYLRDSISSWLDGNLLASLALLRPFLELSVLHIYRHVTADKNGHEKHLEWVHGKKNKPNFHAMVDLSVERIEAAEFCNTERLNLLKESLKKAFKNLCAYNHSPQLDESISTMSKGNLAISAESVLFYLVVASFVLRQVIYLFVLAYPTSLFPVDKYKKWGVSPPVGLYFDEYNYAAIREFLGEGNLETLKLQLENCDDVVDLMSFYNSCEDLPDETLNELWANFCKQTKMQMNSSITDRKKRILLSKAVIRAINWASSYTEKDNEGRMDNDTLDSLMNSWRKLKDW